MKTRYTSIIVSCIIILSLLFASCTKKEETKVTEKESAIETAECLFTPPQGYDIECGYLTVPENRSASDGKTIKIYFAIFRTQNANPEPDPIVYLAGGPGEHALEAASLVFEKRFAPLMENRDLIIFDQRGTGYSEPSLFCPELIEQYYEYLDDDLSYEEGIAMEVETLRKCYERFISEGIDLNAYNSAESAADLNDLRLALGYDEWNLLGISYGTRLALTAMRDFPEGIRSVILASTVPLQTDLYTVMPDNFIRALDVFYADCAADPECSTSYPDLEKTLNDAVSKLNESPVTFSVTHPLTGTSYDVLLDGNGLISFVFEGLYSSEIIPLLPKIIDDAGAGKYDMLSLLMGSTLLNAELISAGMHYSVQFSEEYPFNDPEEIAASLEKYPEFREYFSASTNLGGEMYDIIEYWNTAEPDAVEDKPVSSDIPTLVLAGEYDPITPPAWGMLAAETLPNSYFFEFPGISHDTVFSGQDCVLDMALDFLDTPEQAPDGTCIPKMEKPDFVVLNVNLAPFTIDFYKIKGLYPENWSQIAPGAWQRSSLGITALIQQSAPGMKKDVLLDYLKESVGITEDLLPSDTLEANGLEWSVYRTNIQGLATELILSEKNDTSYLILFSCIPDDYDYYYHALLLPVVNAFMPTE